MLRGEVHLRIRRLELRSYGPFREVSALFEPGLNLIVGRNDAGKSFLLTALRKQLENIPHRSPERFKGERLVPSYLEVDIDISGYELEEAALKRGGQLRLPIPQNEIANNEFFKKVIGSPSIELSLDRRADHDFTMSNSDGIKYPGAPSALKSHRLSVDEGEIRYIDVQNVDNSSIADTINRMWNYKTFYFRPQRFSVGIHSYGRAENLDETASNLPAVLSWLQGERGTLFQKIVQDMQEIFDSVRSISITNTSAGFEIRIWPTGEMVEPELSHSLTSSGTGLGQALAILVAAATTDASVLLIDEINTFLHPGAAKSLLRILAADYGNHQYIVSTHSPEVIGSGLTRSINLVEKNGFESRVRSIDSEKIEELNLLATTLGVSASDVFMYPRIVWVEGQTEEGCFELILRHSRQISEDAKTRFVCVSATGDFFSKKRDRELVLEIYRKLTKTMSPITPKPLFCFDREGLSNEEVQDIRRRSQYQIHFLNRRNIESYLLIPEIIAKMIERDFGDSARSVDKNFVQGRLENFAAQNAYSAQGSWANDLYDVEWLRRVDGAALLKDLFSDLSNGKVEYVKTRDTLALIGLALEHVPDALSELITFVRELDTKVRKLGAE